MNLGASAGNMGGTTAKQWEEIDNLMQKPALTSAETALNKLDKTIKSKGTDEEKLRSIIYRFAINLGCEYSLFDDKRAHYANNLNPQEGTQIILESFIDARNLMLKMNNRANKAIALSYMLDLIDSYQDKIGHRNGTEVEFDEEKYDSVSDKLGIWSDRFQDEELAQYKAVRLLNYKELSELSRSNIKHLKTGIVRELESYVMAGDEDLISAHSYLLKAKGDKKYYTLLSDLITNTLSNTPELFSNNKKETKLEWLWPWKDNWEVNEEGQNASDYIKLLYKQIQTHMKRKELNTAALYFCEYTKNIKSVGSIYNEYNEPSKKDKLKKYYTEAYENMIKALGNDESVVIVANQYSEFMLTEYNTICRPEEMDSTLPAKIIKFCDKYINAYPKAEQIDGLKNTKEIVLRPSFSAETNNTESSRTPIILKLRYANVEEVEVEVLKYDYDIEGSYNEHDYLKEAKPVALKQNKFKLEKSNYYIKKETELQIADHLDYGSYFIKIKNAAEKDNEKTVYLNLSIRDIKTYAIQYNDSLHAVYCVDRVTGNPIEGATVTVEKIPDYYNGVRKTIEKVTTDKNGRALVHNGEHYVAWGSKGEDNFGEEIDVHKDYSTPYNYTNNRIIINTDRAIYRPGQTVFVKTICYRSHGAGNSTLKDSIMLTVKDPNYKTIFEGIKKNNEFGSASFEFTIPTGKRNGAYHIKAKCMNNEVDNFSDSKYIDVEEYLRPKYEIKIDSLEGIVAVGNEITVNGTVRMCSGEPVPNTDITAAIEENYYFYTPIKEGTYKLRTVATTNEEGKFSFKFTPTKREVCEDCGLYYSIELNAVAPSGESLSYYKHFAIPYKEAEINLVTKNEKKTYEINEKKYDLSEKIEAELSSFAYGERAVKSNVTLVLTNKETNESRELAKYEVEGKKSISIDPKSIGIGSWQIKTINNEDNKEIKYAIIDNIVIYDKNSEICPVKKMLWSNIDRSIKISPNKDVDLCIASDRSDAKVLMIHRIGNKEFKTEKWIELNNSMKKLTFKYDDLFTENGGQFEVSVIRLIITKDNTSEDLIVKISKKPEVHKYPITLKTYRDKIMPGNKEKWTIKLNDSTLANSEVLALMYDASLDIYSANSLGHFSYFMTSFYPNRLDYFNPRMYGEYYEAKLKYDTYNFNPWNPSWIWSNALGYKNYGNVKMHRMMAKTRSAAAMMADDSEDTVSYFDEGTGNGEQEEFEGEMIELKEEVAIPKKGNDNSSKNKSNNSIKIRDNFKETAFFYPYLRTDPKTGLCSFEFEVPESLTEWKFMAFAHTKDLKYGEMTTTIKTYQPVSIRASLPRFMRRGDKQSLVATIVKNDNDVKSGKVNVKVIDGLTEKVIFESKKSLNLDTKQSTVNFMFNVPETLSCAVVEFTIEGNKYSDGERYKLPVLANSEHVVKSVNIIAKGGTEKSITLPKVDKNATNTEATVQYTANAAWSVVTALPSAKEHIGNAISIVNAIYVNAIAKNISQTYPDIKKQVEEWETKTDARHLNSPLANDEELKSVLLEETPWVCDAAEEAKWKANLVNTLDVERASKECEKLVNQLKTYQSNNGGFDWMGRNINGVPSYSTTLVVCETLTKMHRRGLLESTPGAKDMLAKALKFIDEVTLKRYELFEKNKVKSVSEYDLHNAFIRMSTQDIVKLDSKVKSIYKDYMNHANKNWVDLTLYGKATLAIIDHMSGDNSTAKKIMEAIRESSTKNDEEGMYWKSNQDFSRVYGSAILRQALCIRAFGMIDPKADEIEMMKQWLIVRKSRTKWESDIATVDAIDAVLFESKNITSKDTKSTLTFGDVTLTDSTENNDEGFVQYTSKGYDIPQSISVKQAKNSVGIGAVYVSYDSKLENITSNASGISVEKKSYILTTSADGDRDVLKEIKDGDVLTVGDRVKVVLKIHNDQDLDFVTLKDRRPACYEPRAALSRYRYENGSLYYQMVKDASMNFMFDRLSKGVYVFEYETSVTHEGEYQSGTATIQCTYNPSYNANSTTEAIKVKSK